MARCAARSHSPASHRWPRRPPRATQPAATAARQSAPRQRGDAPARAGRLVVSMSYLLDGSNWDLSIPTSIPNLLFAHLYITALALIIGLAIAVPVALLVVRYRRFYLP